MSAPRMEKVAYVRVARQFVSVPVDGRLLEKSYPSVEIRLCGMTFTKRFHDEWDLTFAVKLARSHNAPIDIEPEFKEVASRAFEEVDRMAALAGEDA